MPELMASRRAEAIASTKGQSTRIRSRAGPMGKPEMGRGLWAQRFNPAAFAQALKHLFVHEHKWQDTGFANLDDCECGATHERPQSGRADDPQ